MKPWNHNFLNRKLFQNRLNVIEKSQPEHDPNFTRLCDLLRPEVDGDVISVQVIEGYAVLNFEAASISSSRENKNQPFA